MFRLTKPIPLPVFTLLLVLLLLFGMACSSPNQRIVLAEAAPGAANGATSAPAVPVELVFAGQVEDENGRWLNDRVVILFKNGEEVARTTTSLRESAFSDAGPMDGVFELRVTNVYKLTELHDFYFYPSQTAVQMLRRSDTSNNTYLGTWLEDLNPTDIRQLNVPTKQAEYALVVLPMPLAELPGSHERGNLTFQDGLLVIQPEEPPLAEATAVPLPPPATDIRFTLLLGNDSMWHLQMSGYYGNRYDVWEKYVAGRGTGMNWETFKEAVLVYNPHLETDGFVFYPNKTYLLPTSE